MKKKEQIKAVKGKLILALCVSILGFIMIMNLFFWYKTFAYYTHSIYTYQTDDFTGESDSENSQLIKSYSRLNQYYETVIINNSSSDIIVEIYNNSDESAPVLLQDNLLIVSGKEYRFESYEYAYTIIVHGRDITEDNILVEASTISYLKEYRQSVIITIIIGIAMVIIWDIMILCAPGWVEKYGSKINIGIVIFSSMGSILSSIILFKGYYESNLCFIALFCTILSLAVKKREDYYQWKDKAVKIDDIYLAAGIISLFFSCLMMCIMYNSTDTSPLYIFNAINKMSLPDYMITVVVFLILFLIISGIFLKKQNAVSFIKYYCTGKEILICAPAVTAAFFIQQSELGMAGNVGNSILYLIITFILIYAFMYYKPKKKIEEKKASLAKILPVYIIYIFFIMITITSTTVINYFHMAGKTYNYVHHVGWYYRSIYYVINNIPYPDKELGLYGHYQLFYNIPLKIFGTNLLTIGIITGIGGGLTAFFIVGIIHILTKSNFLRVVGTIAAVNVLCFRLYLAIVPHRLLFPMMMLYLITYCRKKEIRWFHVFIGIVISLLSILWNTEMGAVVILTWFAFLLLKKEAGKDQCLGYVIKNAVLTLVVLGVAAVAVLGLVIYFSRIFNVSLSTVLADTFSIMTDTDYMYSNHFNFIRWTNSPWIYIMILFMGMVAFGISRMGFLGMDRDEEQNMPAVISIAVMGLGQMVYFISRPEDYSIVMLPVIFLMIIILDKNKGTLKLSKSGILCICLLFGFGCMISHTGEVIEGVRSRIIEHHQLDYNLFLEDLNVFAMEVPEGSYVPFRQDDGLTEIYMCLGWELPEENNTEYCISTSDNINSEGNYTFVKAIVFGDMKYYLYRNNNYNQ